MVLCSLTVDRTLYPPVGTGNDVIECGGGGLCGDEVDDGAPIEKTCAEHV